MLKGHNNGHSLRRIMEVLGDLGYIANHQVLNALDFGLPQKRERIFIVGYRKEIDFTWPNGNIPMKALSTVLEQNVPKEYYASEYIRKNRLAKHPPTSELTIWHENKGGHISAYPYSCALRAGASYNYLLVNGERRLTPREMLRLQGFPDSFKIVCNYSQTRKQAGNALPVPVAQAILRQLIEANGWQNGKRFKKLPIAESVNKQLNTFEKVAIDDRKWKRSLMPCSQRTARSGGELWTPR